MDENRTNSVSQIDKAKQFVNDHKVGLAIGGLALFGGVMFLAGLSKGHKIGFCDGRTFEFTRWSEEIERIKGLGITDSTKIDATLNMLSLKEGQCAVMANVLGSDKLNVEVLEDGCDGVFLESIRKVFNDLAEPTEDVVRSTVEEVL